MMHKRQLGGILYIKSQRYQKYENVLVPHLALCTVYIYICIIDAWGQQRLSHLVRANRSSNVANVTQF